MSRVRWVDAARGVAIILVVLFHTTNWLSATGLPVDGWIEVNSILATIRLPMFFIVSGLFARKWVESAWGSLWATKLSLFVWVYVLWSIVAAFTFTVGLDVQGRAGGLFSQLRGALTLLWEPRFEFWFIWALAIFFTLARLARPVPVPVQLVVAGALSVVGLSGWFDVNVGVNGIVRYLFFFLVGVYGRELIFRWSQVPAAVAGAVGVVAAAAAIAGTVWDWNTAVPGYYFVSCCLGALAGVAIGRALGGLAALGWVGRNSLPVYLTHTSIVILVCWLLDRIPGFSIFLPAAIVLPAVLAALAVAVSLAIHRFTQHTPALRWIYEQPAWFAARPRAAA